MMTPNELQPYLPQRDAALSFMASLAVAAKEMRVAEGYLLELLACVAFTRPVSSTAS
jgi:hypothetical protein